MDRPVSHARKQEAKLTECNEKNGHLFPHNVLPSSSCLSTCISNDLAYAKKPTISWHGIVFGPTEKQHYMQ